MNVFSEGMMLSCFLTQDSPITSCNYKMGVVKVKKVGESKYKSEFCSFSFAPRNIV